ncbi:MAG: DUF4150 domain-containing protein [Desulfobacterales bacterium]|nr:DUF4150 domain-containing protein [Desulfobacterales bacterium]
MSVTVAANDGLTICHIGSGGKAIATVPDICLTTVGNAAVPIPYPNMAETADLADGSETVTADGGNSIAIEGCTFSKSSGDEAGDQKGLSSGEIQGEAEFVSFSPDVTIEGKAVARLSDQMILNKGNTICMSGVTSQKKFDK